MAAHIPEKLKAADLTRFILRASQLESVKPVIAYWCKPPFLRLSQMIQKLISAGEYWIVNQILSRGLHNGDNETLQYTTTLMDKLEQVSDILAVYLGRR
jgi:vacuolar protein sorting-associated protein VTA1